MELPHIGQNCVICNRNDYLPFKCTRCEKIVCIDHKTNHGSECPINQSSFQANLDDPGESIKKACDFCHKITLKLELVECHGCSQHHCLYHRHQVQHKCPQLDENKRLRDLEEQSRLERQKEALDRLKCTTTQTNANQHKSTNPNQQVQRNMNPKNQALARRVRLMKIKQNARGPPNILDEDKLYFEVKFLHDPECSLSKQDKNGKTVRMFTTAKHTIGRMVDWSADELDLTNKNHLIGADQLCFMNLEPHTSDDGAEPLPLDSQEDFQYYLDKGQLENGDELLLKYTRKS